MIRTTRTPDAFEVWVSQPDGPWDSRLVAGFDHETNATLPKFYLRHGGYRLPDGGWRFTAQTMACEALTAAQARKQFEAKWQELHGDTPFPRRHMIVTNPKVSMIQRSSITHDCSNADTCYC